MVLLDVAQAFDKVWIEGLKKKILDLNIPSYLQTIIFSFLEHRTFAVKVNSRISQVKEIHAGVPQGSILGPLLFNIYTSDIPTVTASLAIFADDTAIITQRSNLDEAIHELQNAVNKIIKWYNNWNIRINPAKCQGKIFSLRRIIDPPNIEISGAIIPWNPKDRAIKYLGVHLDTRLTWSYHINQKLSQGNNRLRQLYPLINRKSSLKPECTILLYKTLLRPLVLYASPVWLNTSKTNIQKLQRFQNKILRIAVNAPWYIRNNQLHFELGVLPIQDFMLKCAKKFFINASACDGAVFFNLCQKNIYTRLKRKSYNF